MKRIFLSLHSIENTLKNFNLSWLKLITMYDDRHCDRRIALNHAFSMLSEMENFLKEGRREKFFRWLGFLQGVLWSFSEFSLNELRNHNRPPE